MSIVDIIQVFIIGMICGFMCGIGAIALRAVIRLIYKFCQSE
jgi:hypothetical protein